MFSKKDWPNGGTVDSISEAKKRDEAKCPCSSERLTDYLKTLSPADRAKYLAPIMEKYKAYYV